MLSSIFCMSHASGQAQLRKEAIAGSVSKKRTMGSLGHGILCKGSTEVTVINSHELLKTELRKHNPKTVQIVGFGVCCYEPEGVDYAAPTPWQG